MIRVLVVDDQSTIRQILRGYLEIEPDLKVVGDAANGQVAIEQVKALKPDVVLMDIEMPVMDGLAATKIISECFIQTKVLILTIHDDENYLKRAFQIGAKGYMLKNSHGDELVNAIRSADKKHFQLGPDLLEKYLFQMLNFQSKSNDITQLKKIIEDQNLQKKKPKEEGESFLKDRNMKAEFHYMKLRMFRLEKNLSLIQNISFVFAVILATIIVLTPWMHLVIGGGSLREKLNKSFIGLSQKLMSASRSEKTGL